MFPLVRPAGLFALAAAAVVAAGTAPAADQKQIDAAVEKGVGFLKGRAAALAPAGPVPGGGGSSFGIGPAALAGIALLAADVPPADPAVQGITKAVREAAVRIPGDLQTYQMSLCLLYLDRLGEPADVPLIQYLGVCLLAGQTGTGGWGYTCTDTPPDAQLADGLKSGRLAAGLAKDEAGAPKLHPAVAQYAGTLAGKSPAKAGADNSNTQFAVLAVWAARKHGVPVDAALNAAVKRFYDTQQRDGGWGYTEGGGAGSRPAMTCAGLLALATHVARKEEEWAKARAERKEKEKKAPKEAKPGDEFFSPPARAEKKDRRPPDPVDERVGVAFQSLGAAFAAAAAGGGGHAARLDDLYFLWSLERVGVLYEANRIGGLDWYAVGADLLVRTQKADGSWSIGSYTPEVNASFAVLFLVKANLARDLTGKMRGAGVVELTTGGKPAGEPAAGARPARPPGGEAAAADPGEPALPKLDLSADDEPSRLAVTVVGKSGGAFADGLKQLRDAKGADYTKALVQVIVRTDGDRRRQAREALADRLWAEDARALRGLMADPHPELRRGAVVAAAMQDDSRYVPDLIARVAEDDEELVVRAARAGLKSLTGSKEDLGPADGASKAERKAAAAAWKAFWEKQKK